MTVLVIDMPIPPSVNALFKNLPQGGRARTRVYDAWIEEAGYAAVIAWRTAGRPSFSMPIGLLIDVGLVDRRRDAGNVLKPVEDLLVKTIPGLPDDRHNDSIVIRRGGDAPRHKVRVTITSLPGEAPG